ncbi:hypothetical protein KAJ38_02585 [Candidatus Pacearchaeota archaeon]|nr:hypothetical protein [Candidatus Pacearchaeota archaeon]
MEVKEYKGLNSKLTDIVNELKLGQRIRITLKESSGSDNIEGYIEGYIYGITDKHIQTRYTDCPRSFFTNLANWAVRDRTDYDSIKDIKIVE